MSAKNYGILMRVMAVGLAAFIAVSIILELPVYVPLTGVMLALVIASIFRQFVKEVMTDERNRHIEEKASAITYRTYTIITAMFALIVLMLRSSLPPWAATAAETLAYSVCVLMLMHLVSTKYYSGKL